MDTEQNYDFDENPKRKFSEFVKKQGFYIALGVCVLIVGLTVLLALNWNNGDQEEVEQTPSQTQEDEDVTVQTPEVSPSTSPSPSDTEDDDQSTSTVPSFKIAMPLVGTIVKHASLDKLVYNNTLNQWATHNGIDIKADAGTNVLAAASGTVETIYSDDVIGDVIVIAHSGNYKTLYAGVKPVSGIEEGTKVNEGQIIGTLGTPIFEKHLEAHLHFELLNGEEYLDPEKYLK